MKRGGRAGAMRFEIKAMETPAEIEGKGYVHWKSWQEAYRGLIDPAYLETMTLKACVKRAYEWRDGVLVAKDGPRVVWGDAFGPIWGPWPPDPLYAARTIVRRGDENRQGRWEATNRHVTEKAGS